jgi:hypothetical protein
LLPDRQFPGFADAPPAPSVLNMTFEAVAYLQLERGIYRMGVTSDDGFRVANALSFEEVTSANVLGEFSGGRAAADTVFDFEVTQDGLYPFRLTWEQGAGGANVEWWVFDPDGGGYHPVNPAPAAEGEVAPFPTSGPLAFVPPCTGKTLSVEQGTGTVIVRWPLAGGGNLFQLQQTTELKTPPQNTMWNNVAMVPQTIGGMKTVVLPTSGGQTLFFRLSRPGPPNCP